MCHPPFSYERNYNHLRFLRQSATICFFDSFPVHPGVSDCESSYLTGILTSAGWTSCQHSSIKVFTVSIRRLNHRHIIIFVCQAPLFFHSRHWKNCISSGERKNISVPFLCQQEVTNIAVFDSISAHIGSSIVTTYFGKLSRTPANAPNSRWMVSSEASR